MKRSTYTLLCVAGLLVLCWRALGGLSDPVGADVVNLGVHPGLILFGAVPCLISARRHGDDRVAWTFLGLALVALAIGEASWSLFYDDLASAPVPSVSDIFWVAWYPLAWIGLASLMRRRVRHVDRALLLDGLAGVLVVAALEAAIVLPVVARAAGEGAALVMGILYPLLDLLLLGMVVAAFAAAGWRPDRRWAVIGASLAITAIADSAYLAFTAEGSWPSYSIIDALYPLSSVLIGGAALMRGGAVRRATAADGLRVIVAPVLFAFVAIVMLAWGIGHRLPPLGAALALLVLVVVSLRLLVTFREHVALLARVRHDAHTDHLTGLGNRRALMDELHDAVARAVEDDREIALVLFDLNGFKLYNDAFGHPAGDALLARLGHRFAEVADGHGRAFRLGGDEFCMLLRHGAPFERLAASAARALSAHGEGFSVTCERGSVRVPAEAQVVSEALTIADRRLYGRKDDRPSSAGRQATDVLLEALHERQPGLRTHIDAVAVLARGTARRLGMAAEDIVAVERAAELHDVGKVAIPDTILDKPGPLDDDEWAFMRRHTLIGERIVAKAPSLNAAARLVRCSHERWDGTGYPDRLAGEEIPLGARVIAVCDAFDAMTSERSYSRPMAVCDALAELRACAGTQFDADVVEAFIAEVVAEDRAPVHG